ncbi:ganglioside-induced differentiation-associated protein 1 [Scaptodrosophila lebanonensis]|uniref:Ganglioside-induced differentiation-associated protein 1 n=1 Tax=Drosophila lebanonensis TaxID=7225 RepID=A0A6J2T9T6_DROLE|nr:ganglioside-induced differentiation-associated protein 1 [Scaptodrosophila lebanonensis]XP_030371893.1 ganglioside-induced differentiation-associated protein 1 [Scaptodrosophila lebanonensis]
MSDQTKEIASAPPTLQDFKAPTFQDNKLVLFFHPYNFYSQKVLLVLYEKNIDFIPYIVDLSNGEQYSSWFLNLNPKGDVPVLQDGAFVVPDSMHIINYLESKFRGENHPLLKPQDANSPVFDQVLLYERALGRLPVGALSLGSFIHDDLKLAPKPPFIGPVRKSCLSNNEKVLELLKRSVDELDTKKAALEQKLKLQQRRKDIVYSREEFQRVLDAVKHVLLYVEQELTKQARRHDWLVSDDLTLADISLGLLLHRLYQLGFENYYWSYGKLPQVESYFLRFKRRASYHKLMPSNFEILKDMWAKTPGNYKIGAGAGFIGMAMFAAFAHK